MTYQISGALDRQGAATIPERSDLQVVIATPFGEGQRGGIDRLMDLMIATLRHRPELQL